jgi:pyruvate-formate lyase-activating enzyme
MDALAGIHEFVEKLEQGSVFPHVQAYASALADDRPAFRQFFGPSPVPRGPLSINLDLTVACNHACPHCIDENILNSGMRLRLAEVVDTLMTLRMVGLRTVILIGGGEPTVHPDFAEIVRVTTLLGLGCGIVSNGSMPDRLERVAPYLRDGDWIRLSIDAATDATFQQLHRPRRPTTLHAVCANARRIKAANPNVSCGFSFVIVTPAVLDVDPRLVANDHEIAAAARLAKDAGFDYVSFKPYLVRDAEGKEVLPERLRGSGVDGSVQRVRAGIEAARACADEAFRVVPSLNLLALLEPRQLARAQRQPGRCHMQALRQVITPHGIYGCPAYRGDPRSRIADRDGYVDLAHWRDTAGRTRAQVDGFDASRECRNITCLYNTANWWVDGLVDDQSSSGPALSRSDAELPVFL